MPVEIPQRKGDPVVFSTDEGVRGDTTLDSLGKLRPAFDKEGNITAGNASQISDGGAAVVVMSAKKAAALEADGTPAMDRAERTQQRRIDMWNAIEERETAQEELASLIADARGATFTDLSFAEKDSLYQRIGMTAVRIEIISDRIEAFVD